MMKITFQKEIAKEFGLNESIVLEELYVRIQQKGIPLNGKVWIECTYEKWQEVFPFWSISTIKRTFSSLKKQGLILMEQHGKHRYDRTNWYAFTNEGMRHFSERETTTNVENSHWEKREEQQDVVERDGNSTTKIETHTHIKEENGIHDKISIIQKQLKNLRFYPLRTSQKEELAHACRTFPLEQIIEALTVTAERAIFAWKYAYKVLLTNKKTAPKRKIIRTEKLPDWFQEYKPSSSKEPEQVWDEEALARRQRLLAIQEKYKQQPKPTCSSV